jgi:hypothetical protein
MRWERVALGSMLQWWLLTCAFVGGMGGAVAQAQDLREETARAHFRAATSYYDMGHYDDAAAEFEKAYRLSGRPQLLHNLYLCHERLGNLGEATQYLERYLAETEDVPNREALESRLERLRERAAGEGIEEGEEDVVDQDDPAAGAEPRTGSSGLRTAGWAALGVGAAGLVTFGVAAAMAASEDGRLADVCGRDAGRTCTDDEVAGLRRRTLTADVGLGVGVAGAVAGLVFLLLSRKGAGAERKGAEPAVVVRPLLGPTMAGAFGEVRF